ncbi:thiamine-phosphate kinase [Pleurocapsales cyanobacterium LEGE 10410]|nr:thiamine-phosphate kinase [Pleurocapsales cyanobacterium LEGE 10410]
MSDESLLVRDLGEHGLLEKLQRFCPQDIIGDDGAILATTPNKSLVVTTDVLVDGVHFSDRTTTAFDVGWRATAANLSDLAAMGATPLGITVGLSLPGKKLVSWVEKLYQGISACLRDYQTPLVGGDICRSAVTSIAITALGEVIPQQAIRRSQARLGDAIVITGLHGLSRGGLELLQNPGKGDNLEPVERDRMIQAHQRPKPRLDLLPYLAKISQEIAIAGMDSSDGLADAIRQICRYSGVGAVIDRGPAIFPGLIKLAGFSKAREWMLYGGEDFELVLCLPQNYALNLVRDLGGDAAIIGKITEVPEIKLVDSNKLVTELDIDREFRHF